MSTATVLSVGCQIYYVNIHFVYKVNVDITTEQKTLLTACFFPVFAIQRLFQVLTVVQRCKTKTRSQAVARIADSTAT